MTLLVCTYDGLAISPIVLKDMKGGKELLEDVEYVEDKHLTNWADADTLTFQALRELKLNKEGNFVDLYLGTRSAYWLRFTLENPNADSLSAFLKIGVFDSLSLYRVGNVEPLSHAGLLASVGQNDYPNGKYLKNKYALPIQLGPEEKATFYLRVKNIFRFEEETISLVLYEAGEEHRMRADQLFPFLLFNGLFFGVLLFLMCFFGLQYLQDRSPTNGYYLLYLLGTFLYFWWKFEKAHSYVNVLALFRPEWHYYYEIPISVVVYATYSLFVVHFLDAKQNKPHAYHFILKGLTYIYVYLVLQILISMIGGVNISGFLHYFIRHLFVIAALYAAYQLFQLNNRLFTYILIGTILLLIGGIVTTYFSFTLKTHYAGPWDIPLIPVKLGVLAEILCFSVGLGYKNRLVEQEKQAAQEKLIDQLQKNERMQQEHQAHLEAEVLKKAEEIEEKNEQLLLQREDSYKKNLLESELKALKAQLNPHFIFNCLNAIKNLIGKGESDQAEKYLVTFSKVMRSALTYSEIEAATLAEEMKISKNYIQMEALRFQEVFDYSFHIDPKIDLRSISIPPLILQPHLENAIKHGLLPKKGDKSLQIIVEQNGQGGIVCTIEDNGVGREFADAQEKPAESGDGTRITLMRLDLFNQKFNQSLSFEIIDKYQPQTREALGTKVALHIPNSSTS